MIGALIGDLAAWSWENDKELFYSQLVSYDTKPSIYGRAILNAASRNLLSNQNNTVEPEGEPYSLTYNAEWLMWIIVGAWEDRKQLRDMPQFKYLETKEAHYSGQILYSLVHALRNGSTKSEVFHNVPQMHDFMKEHHGYHWALAHEMMETSKNKRTFFPKNQALTNVERHKWKSVDNPFFYIILTKEQRNRILLSAPTNLECRYGLYLDDGWIYSYRSGVLIGRFQIKEESNDIWRIDNLQLGERNFKELCMAMNCAIYEGCGITLLGEVALVISALKYYNGELKMPEAIRDTVNGKFWYGEMMFVNQHIEMEYWKQDAQECLEKLTGEKEESFSKYSP